MTAVVPVLEVLAILADRVAYFQDNPRGHFDRDDAARSYRATSDQVARLPSIEVDGWNFNMQDVPRDRDVLIQLDHGEVTIGSWRTVSSPPVWQDGQPYSVARAGFVFPARSMRPIRVNPPETVVAWRDLPKPGKPQEKL